MIKIAVCDDDKFITSQVEELLLYLAKANCLRINVDVFYDGSTLETAIGNGEDYDLLYLDIEMMQDGIITAERLRVKDVNSLIIYISSHHKYLRKLFDVGVFRFLDKPINKDLFRKYFLVAVAQINSSRMLFSYQFDRVTYKVEVKNIMYFESKMRTIYMYLLDKKPCMFYGRLNDIEKKIADIQIPFIRTHQSFLVNYQYIFGCGKANMELKNGTYIPISEDRLKRVEQYYGRLLREDIFND